MLNFIEKREGEREREKEREIETFFIKKKDVKSKILSIPSLL